MKRPGEELVQESVGDMPMITFGDIGWRDYASHLKAMKAAGKKRLHRCLRPPALGETYAVMHRVSRESRYYVEIMEPLPTGLRGLR